ncbi:MAG TPA: lysoplasmalogenase [Candidatus Dormibacteraeota bacterium]|nr:lysoplasmalogenase [Candidatus Dormibacteraeota bacterium]
MADWFAVATRRKPLEYACKPLTLALLTGVALALHPAYDSRRAAFAVALVLSLLGDVFLMLPRDMFAFGLASFLLGHIAYVVGLRNGPGNTAALVAASIGVVVIAAVVGRRVLQGVVASGHRELTGPVVAYMAVLAAMLVCALATLNPLAGLGAGLFFCSDAVLSWNRFVRPLAWGPLAVIVSYHLGQGLLVLSLVRR